MIKKFIRVIVIIAIALITAITYWYYFGGLG